MGVKGVSKAPAIAELRVRLVGILTGAAAFALLGCGPAAPATLTATPANVGDVIGRARSGDTVVLAAGDYPVHAFRRHRYDPPLVIDAHAATITGWLITGSKGITIHGGTFMPPAPGVNPKTGGPAWTPALRLDNIEAFEISGARFVGPGHPDTGSGMVYGESYGLFVNVGANVNLLDSTFTGFKSSAVLQQVTGFHVANITFTYMRSDGLDVALSRNGIIEGLDCHDTLIRNDEHPDCVQLWSRPARPPSSDIVIRKNKVVGNTQGITMFNHVRDGVDDGGFDRITVEDIDVTVGYPHGIAMGSARNSILRNNHVRTLPGAKWRASINVGTSELQRCGNTVEAGAGKPAITDPHC